MELLEAGQVQTPYFLPLRLQEVVAVGQKMLVDQLGVRAAVAVDQTQPQHREALELLIKAMREALVQVAERLEVAQVEVVRAQ